MKPEESRNSLAEVPGKHGSLFQQAPNPETKHIAAPGHVFPVGQTTESGRRWTDDTVRGSGKWQADRREDLSHGLCSFTVE